MAKQHTTTLKFEAYLVGMLINVIWGDDWNAKYFVDNSTKISFGKLIHDMYDLNPEAQKTVQTRCAHIDGVSIQLDYTWRVLSKATIDSL